MTTTKASSAGEWKPTPWIAALLGLLLTPLGMLYVQRLRLAIGYSVLALSVGIATFLSVWLTGSAAVAFALSLTSWIVAIVCAVHAFRIARATPNGTRAWYSRWYGLASVPLAIAATVFLVRSFAYEPFRTPSESMHPTLPAGSLVIVQKQGFGHYGTYGVRLWNGAMTQRIKRGDIVIHRLVQDPATNYISRVVGLPGERIEYRDQRLLINGVAVPTELGATDERYQYAVERFDDVEVTVAFMPERLQKDFAEVLPLHQYAVFGDNRDNARDSRYLGLIPEQNIVGRVVKVLRPAGWQEEQTSPSP